MTPKEKSFLIRKVMRKFIKASIELSEAKDLLETTGFFSETVDNIQTVISDLETGVESFEGALQGLSAEVQREKG